MFKTFPEFSKLTLADKAEYEKFIKDFPPLGDISFAGLMTWWDSLNGVSIAELNGNLVVQYWRPGDEASSGLSLIGTNQVDVSICTIFDFLRERGDPVRLVNVPEFVISEIQYHDLFHCTEQRKYHEYVAPLDRFYPLKNITNGIKRHRISRILKRLGEDEIIMKSLELRSVPQLDLLLDAAEEWWPKNLNNFGQVGYEAMKKCILQSEELEIENVCIFASNKLLGFCLYQLPSDRRYAVLLHVKATHKDAVSFELFSYLLSRWFAERGAMYANLTEDWGRIALRMFLLTLAPVNLFRKYKVEPASKRNLFF